MLGRHMMNIFNSKWVLGILSAITVVTAAATFTAQNAGASYVQDCKDNSVIKCGAPDARTLVNKAKTNSPSDLQAIYSHFNLKPGDYERFASTARPGVAYKDGRVVVDGQTVITSAWSLGRDKKSYSNPMTINGKTYHTSYLKDVMLNDQLPVMVYFTAQGEPQTVIMNACANPISGNTKVPSYACNMLNKEAVKGKQNTYMFSTNASASQNASIAKVVYDFGDGKTVTQTNPATKVTHTYAKAGTYTAKVTVYVNLPGKQVKTVVSGKCQTTITITEPFQECVALTSRATAPKDRAYEFKVTSRQGNGSVLKSATFDFGDGKSATNVGSTTATTVITNHTYAKAGDYTIVATLKFNTPSGEKSVKCQTKVNITPESCPIKPEVPKDSPECAPCPYDESLPEDSPACAPPETPEEPEAPEELPVTGIGGVAAAFAGTSFMSGIGYHIFSNRRNRLF